MELHFSLFKSSIQWATSTCVSYTDRDIMVSKHRHEPSHKANHQRPPWFDHHVRYCSDCHATCQRRVLHVHLRTKSSWDIGRYSTNHVYLHRPNAFGVWQPHLHLCYENTQMRFKLFWIGLRIRNAFGMNRNCTFCVCLFSQILICDLWALGGFSFIQN